MQQLTQILRLLFVQVFAWEADQANVVAMRTHTCVNVQNGVEIAPSSQSSVTVYLNQSGSFHFASGLAGQCEDGMLLTVLVAPRNDTGATFAHSQELVHFKA